MYKLILIIFTMSLHEQIRGEIKDAMKARDAVRLSTVRNMITAFTNELVATGKMHNLPDSRHKGYVCSL